MNSSSRNWINSINWQIDFYRNTNPKPRTDPEFPWTLVDDKIKRVQIFRDMTKQTLLMLRCQQRTQPQEWLNSNYAERLWESRSLLKDDLSKLLCDETIVLRLTGHQRFYFPRIDFNDFFDIIDEKPFHNSNLPDDYVGMALRIFEIQLKEHPNIAPIKVVTCKENLTLLNSYRQYFVKRNSIDISPTQGDVVLDCGSCIGDISLLFAGLVAMHGEVHMFDPIPLHARYCQLQSSLNPLLAHVLHINELSVSNRTFVTNGDKKDSDKIAPGGLAINSFASISIDDYANRNLNRVDFIKMDIEGAEMDAIEGAAKVIKEFKPRLAISAYHKTDDLWEIPIKLKSLNPSYELYFGHHSPVSWESVFYAVNH
jgi:FkbM family methyltransferase